MAQGDHLVINIRVSAAEKRHLSEVAALNGQTLSSLLREASLLRARRILAEFKPHLVQT